MARLFVTGFRGDRPGFMAVQCTIDDPSTGMFDPNGSFAIAFDPYLSTSVRQQIADKLVEAVNAEYLSQGKEFVIIGSDVEFLA